MNINHLRYFLEVCKYKNFTKASESIHISQPAITAAIKELERELGFRIFDRIHNRIYLTPNGSRFLSSATQIVESFDNFYREAKELGKNQKTVLKIGVPAILGTFFLERILPDFERKNPNIRLVIYEVPTITGLKMVDEASLDFLIGVIDDNFSSFCCKTIFEMDLVLFLNPKNPLAKEKSITREMLVRQPFVMVPKGSYLHRVIDSEFSGTPLNIVLYSTQVATIRYMIQNNLAVTILYQQLFEGDKAILSRPLAEPLTAKAGLFWKKNTYVTSAMKTFTSYIRNIGLTQGKFAM